MYLPPRKPPFTNTDPWFLQEHIVLNPGFTLVSVDVGTKRPWRLYGISAKYNFDTVAAGSNPLLKIIPVGNTSPMFQPVNVSLFASPGAAQPGFTNFTGYVPIEFPYLKNEPLMVELSGYSGAFPTFVDLCFWGRAINRVMN